MARDERSRFVCAIDMFESVSRFLAGQFDEWDGRFRLFASQAQSLMYPDGDRENQSDYHVS
jgi:hypothetical protein